MHGPFYLYVTSKSICHVQALELKAGDRAMLVGFLPESLEPSADDSADAAWCEETERRTHALDQGTVEVGNDNP